MNEAKYNQVFFDLLSSFHSATSPTKATQADSLQFDQ